MAREMAVQSMLKLATACVVVVVCLALQASANITYEDYGPYQVDEGRKGSEPITHYFDWKVQYANVTRLCHTKSLVTINGQFPGPPIYIREDDRVVIKVTNEVSYNVTLHWHGIRQVLQNWQDGPAYITQCPIQTGDSFTYNFVVGSSQRGTVWYHAHITWLRASLYGAFIVLPKKGVPYPFPKPDGEQVILFGEWWNTNYEDVETAAIRRGAGYNISDALLLNGQPGDLYHCSSQETTVVQVEYGKTYLLRLINSAMNFEQYFSIYNHNLTVVEADGAYTKQLETSVVLLTPGQSMNVLVKANEAGGGRFYIATSVWSPAPAQSVPFPTVSATAILEYVKPKTDSSKVFASQLPAFPAHNDSAWALDFDDKIRALANKEYPITVPKNISPGTDLLFTVGYNLQLCNATDGCGLQNGTAKLVTSINNITFVEPERSILEAYFDQMNNVYSPDFPDDPPFFYNFTGTVVPSSLQGLRGTRLNVIPFGSEVQLVFQNTNLIFFESHPFHLHGFSFYIVGSGFGTFNATEDPKNFNLDDPPLRNTAAIPAGGWTAVRWKADNPGVWFMHCHLEIHTSWGMAMGFIVQNGHGPLQTLPPPPPGMPKC